MKTSTLARKTTVAFAIGLIAGAAMSQVRTTTRSPHGRTEPAKPAEQSAAPTAADVTAPDVAPAGRGVDTQGGAAGPTKKQLYHEARKRNIPGRSAMTKAELQRALR
jgi:hypothetical protein